MVVYWIRHKDQPFLVWTAIQIEPNTFVAQIPYLEGDEIRMQTHYISRFNLEESRKAGTWVVVHEFSHDQL